MKFENILALFLVASLLMAGCTQAPADKPVDAKVPTIDGNVKEKIVETEGKPEGMMDQTPKEMIETGKEMMTGKRIIEVTAKQWEFQPAEIKVKQGEEVELKIKSLDVKHGLWIPGMDINVQINPGEEVIVQLKTDKKGTFETICSFQCGAGHSNMKGKIIVE